MKPRNERKKRSKDFWQYIRTHSIRRGENVEQTLARYLKDPKFQEIFLYDPYNPTGKNLSPNFITLLKNIKKAAKQKGYESVVLLIKQYLMITKGCG